ncbi:hypothetical protein [Burkholderia lata]|uniref:Uncharacterized protein n=1 Tax=Burkholderia lata (strain ATCC 17760 / DSM 23089 / LMG 22485 / NCIMB 9086 / R18194 / 383) TaxID=482957 RepID=A0A6P2LT31_BURL3|nr:hypothetical protein [Burkholderia lata]VWB70304.1 hypothetical protein BLA6863_03296 [Burkholderia lata]
MSDTNAAPSGAEPDDNHQWTPEQLAAIQAGGTAPMHVNQIPEAGGAVAGELVSDAAGTVSIRASFDSAASTSADARMDSASSPNIESASAIDDPNADASPAAGQSASDTASSVQDASQGGDTAADVSRAEIDATHAQLVAAQLQIADAHELIANLQQQLTDEQAEVMKWQAAYNASTATRVAGEPPAAHRWVSLLEGKLTVLEHEARDELLDVARQLREAL